MNNRQSSEKLISGPIPSTLIKLSAPMLLGIISMMSFNLIDAFFIGQLGALQLAAIAITFPVVMIISMFTLGLGVGAMAVISRTIGEGDRTGIRRYATDSLSLSFVCVLLLAALGIFTIAPLFRMMGATDDILPFVKQYMLIWYPGMVFFVVPMIGNNIIRSTGDTLTPSLLLLGSMAVNTALDPLFIFGWGPVPHMGIAGAAIASAVSRGIALAATIWVIHFREKLLTDVWPGRERLFASWKAILSIGLPVAVSNAVIPLAMGVMTRIIIHFGPDAIAGFGVATRIEAFGLTPIIAISNGISPFVGQNIGAQRIDRIKNGLFIAKMFSLGWGLVLFAAFLIIGPPLTSIFNSSPAVAVSASLYLRFVSLSLGLRGIHQIIWTALNVMKRPYDSLILELILAFGLWVPLSLAGSSIAGLPGVFIGLSCANCIAGAIAWIWVDRVVDRVR
jgi:putative MATE family efflux protein